MESEKVTYGIYIDGFELPQNLRYDFAVWLLLPIAMQAGEDLHIRGAVDPVVMENAKSLSKVWALWKPETYSEVSVSCESLDCQPPSEKRKPDIMLFSGGVDSTHALLNKESISTGTVLTIHGMDYRHGDDEKFKEFLRKTTPILKELSYDRIIARTDIAKAMPLDTGHGFILAGMLFIFSQYFEKGLIASDFTWVQDMMTAPWGTNHITNPYFAGSDFHMETLSSNFTRAQKISSILNNKTALSSITFCKNYAIRPHNCGKCSKCIRTKTMFIADSGDCPDIFKDRSFTPTDIEGIDLHKKMDFVFFHDVISHAREKGNIKKLSLLELKLNSYITNLRKNKNRKKNRITKLLKKAKKIFS